MNYLAPITYGLIIGHWLLNVRSRVLTGRTPGRFGIIAMHTTRDEFVRIGVASDRETADTVAGMVEDLTDGYISVVYDLGDLGDRYEFENKDYTERIDLDDEDVIREARALCLRGR
jgi:hypothetical protein